MTTATAITGSKERFSDELNTYLRSTVAPRANRLDSDAAALFESFHGLGKKGWLAPKNAQAFGGLALSSDEYQTFQQAIARYSGALAFLQTQHQSAASLIASSQNKALRQKYLPGMASGEQRLGVGFSQLRRRPAPLGAQIEPDGYRLNGTVPWVTGAGLFTDFVTAAVLPDQTAVFGVVPLTSQSSQTGELIVGQPMALAGMTATNTVEVQLQNWFLAKEQVVGTRPARWIEQRDKSNPLSPLGLIFGCTQASLDQLNQSLKRRQIDHAIAQQLQLKLAWIQRDLARVANLPEEASLQKTAFRGRAIALMNTCAQAAVIAASGAANGAHHPTQRIYKESLVFSVSGQTTASAIATFNRLLQSL